MRVLIETNALADLLLGRDPYYDMAYNILTMKIKDFHSMDGHAAASLPRVGA